MNITNNMTNKLKEKAKSATRMATFIFHLSTFNLAVLIAASLTSCEAESPFGGENGEAITATASMPKNLATLTRAMPHAATGLTLHYTAAKTNELAECTVPDENITGNFIDGTFSFTTSWGSTNAAENLLWGQVAKEDNCTFYLTAESNGGVPMWATATAAHGSEIAFGRMSYRKAEFWLVVESEHNLDATPTFTATMKVVPAAETADVTQLAWPTTGGEAEELTFKANRSIYLAPQTLADATLTIEAEELEKTWTLDLSTVDVLNQDGSATGRKANEFPAGQSLTLTVSLSLTQLGTPGSIEITDFTAVTSGYTAELGGTTNPGYTISADGKTYTVTNRYGLQAWLDAYAKDPTLQIVVDFPTENVDLTLPEAFATDTTWPVSGNTWAGKTWKSVLFVDGEGNKKVILDAATTDKDVLKAAILAAVNNGVSLVLTGDKLATDEDGYSYFLWVAQDFLGAQVQFANSIDLVLPEVTELPNNAFYSCTFLRSVSAPLATTVGNYAFLSCTALTTVSLPEATTIEGNTFAYCSALTSVDLPEATSIGEYAFDECTSLATVNLPKAETIMKSAFIGCSALTGIELPAATTIGEYAFQNCTALTTVNLPAATTIGGYAFFSCEALTDVTFGSVVESVGTFSFLSASTTSCTLTLAEGQKQSETLAPSGKTWADYTWQEIKFE